MWPARKRPALDPPAPPDREHAKAPATGEPSGEAAVAPPSTRAASPRPVAPPSLAGRTQPNITQQDNFASHQHEWTAESDRIMLDESDEEWVPMMPPPEQYDRRERRRIPIRAARSSANPPLHAPAFPALLIPLSLARRLLFREIAAAFLVPNQGLNAARLPFSRRGFAAWWCHCTARALGNGWRIRACQAGLAISYCR